MGIEQIEMYKTTDGTVFDNQADAEIYEREKINERHVDMFLSEHSPSLSSKAASRRKRLILDYLEWNSKLTKA